MHTNGQYAKWYVKQKQGTQYIARNQIELTKQLARKSELMHKIEELKSENRAIDAYVGIMESKASKLSRMVASEQFRKLLEVEEDQYKTWSQDYERNTKYPEGLIHKCVSGNFVRSKSEVLIDMALFQHNISYRYECALDLGGITLWPDFTIMHPITGKVVYWEHFGMADNADYIDNCTKKIKLYLENGIVPTRDLIMTFETRDKPLNMEMVEKMIEMHLLS